MSYTTKAGIASLVSCGAAVAGCTALMVGMFPITCYWLYKMYNE